MGRRIGVVDTDRPGETLEVEVLARDESVLTLAVANTIVQFSLFRSERNAPYKGSLGGRSFCFAPPLAKAQK